MAPVWCTYPTYQGFGTSPTLNLPCDCRASFIRRSRFTIAWMSLIIYTSYLILIEIYFTNFSNMISITSKLLCVQSARSLHERGVACYVCGRHPLENWGRAATIYPVLWSLVFGDILEELAFSASLHGYTSRHVHSIAPSNIGQYFGFAATDGRDR